MPLKQRSRILSDFLRERILHEDSKYGMRNRILLSSSPIVIFLSFPLHRSLIFQRRRFSPTRQTVGLLSSVPVENAFTRMLPFVAPSMREFLLATCANCERRHGARVIERSGDSPDNTLKSRRPRQTRSLQGRRRKLQRIGEGRRAGGSVGKRGRVLSP